MPQSGGAGACQERRWEKDSDRQPGQVEGFGSGRDLHTGAGCGGANGPGVIPQAGNLEAGPQGNDPRPEGSPQSVGFGHPAAARAGGTRLDDGDARRPGSFTQNGLQSRRALAAWSWDGKLRACVLGRAVKLWRADTGRYLRDLGGHRTAIGALSWARDNATLTAGCKDGSVHVWDVPLGERQRTLPRQPWLV